MSDYKRLTYKDNMNEFCDYADCVTDCCNCYLQRLHNRLAELEDKIENGTLVELPCKVGDTVYWVVMDYDWDGKVLWRVDKRKFTYKCLDYWGDSCFLTQAEAEAELAKIRGQQ